MISYLNVKKKSEMILTRKSFWTQKKNVVYSNIAKEHQKQVKIGGVFNDKYIEFKVNI